MTETEAMAVDVKKDEVETENGEKTEGEEGKEVVEKKEEKVFKYRDSYNATAEEHENSCFLWIKSSSLMDAVLDNLDKAQTALKETFVDKFEVGIPKLKLPLLMHIYVEMQSKEDKFKVMSTTSRPEKWTKQHNASNIVTQSVVLREETFFKGPNGNLEEALDFVLPQRNVLYKDQLALRSKDMDESLDQAIQLCNEFIAKDRRFLNTTLTKPAVDNLVPMVPNVGYERSVTLDLEKNARSKKIIAGLRVVYEKEEVKKKFFIPVSECSHIAPQIVKSAEAVAEYLTAAKFDVFDSDKCRRDLYGLKFVMNDIGEVILSVVLVLDDKFEQEFYDISNTENVPNEVIEYFKKGKGGKIILEDDVEGDGEDGDAADDSVVKEEKVEKMDEDKPADDGEKKADEVKKENGTEEKEKDEGIQILRESVLKPIPLKKSAFLNRVSDQITDHLTRFPPVLIKFFEERAAGLGISGIFITWHAANKRPTEWSANLKHWYHVCGSSNITETVHNIKLDVYPHLESRHPPRSQIIPTLMTLLMENLGIDSTSTVAVACDYYVVQSFFAEKCKKTLVMSYLNEALRHSLRLKFKNTVSFVSARGSKVNIVERCRRHFGGLPHAAIHWGQYQDKPIKKLFLQRVKKVAVVIDPRERSAKKQTTNAEILKKMTVLLHPQYTLKKVVGVDVCPQKNVPVSIVAFFEANTGRLPYSNNYNRGIKRKHPNESTHPNAKRAMGVGPNQRPNQNDRPGGGRGGRGGSSYGGKRPNNDVNRRGPMQRSRGGPNTNRSRFNQRPPHPWNDRFDSPPHGNRPGGYGNDGQPEPSVQAAKAVLSQLNTLIENQLILAQMSGGPPRTNRPDDSWSGGRNRDSFGGGSRGPSFGDDSYGFRDRSPHRDGGRGGFGGGDRRGGGPRRGGGGGGGGPGNKPYRFNNRRN